MTHLVSTKRCPCRSAPHSLQASTVQRVAVHSWLSTGPLVPCELDRNSWWDRLKSVTMTHLVSTKHGPCRGGASQPVYHSRRSWRCQQQGLDHLCAAGLGSQVEGGAAVAVSEPRKGRDVVTLAWPQQQGEDAQLAKAGGQVQSGVGVVVLQGWRVSGVALPHQVDARPLLSHRPMER